MMCSIPTRFSIGLLVCVVLGAPAESLAFRGGAPSGRTGSTASGGNSCMQCHGAAAGVGMVEIVGAPMQYELDRIYDLVVRVTDPNQAGAGFQISVEDDLGNQTGTLSVSDATNTQDACCAPGWITHTSTGVSNAVADWVANGNSAEYSVQWQAPSVDVGTITFWAAGNAINNNFGNSGDIIYLTNVSATVDTAIDGDFDNDGDVDLSDFSNFSLCFGGANLPPAGSCPPGIDADFDDDGDVDLSDFSIFSLNFTGPL